MFDYTKTKEFIEFDKNLKKKQRKTKIITVITTLVFVAYTLISLMQNKFSF